MIGFLMRPFRTLLLVGLSFLAGMIYATSLQNKRCASAQGVIKDSICIIRQAQ